MTDLFATAWGSALLVFLAVALAVVCLALLWEGGRRARQERTVARQLRSLAQQVAAIEAGADRGPSLFRPEEKSSFANSAFARFVPRLSDAGRLLEQADVNWGVGTFLLLSLGLAAGAGLAGTLIFADPVGPIVFAATGAVLPYLYLRRRRTKRWAAFEEHFPDAIELFGRSLRAGHALLTGLEVVAQEAPDPVNQEFQQVYEQQRFGLPLKESLLGLADRMDTVDVRMFVTSVMIQRESGGNLAEILDNLAHLIRERFKFRRQLRVHTAQGRLTGYLLALLPIAVGFALFLINRDYMIVLIQEPRGRMMLLGSLVMQVLGFLWIRRIVDIEF